MRDLFKDKFLLLGSQPLIGEQCHEHQHLVAVEQRLEAVGGDRVGQHRGCAAPESQGAVGVSKLVDVEFERVGMREPADVGRAALVEYAIVDPEKAGTRSTAQELDAGADDEVGIPAVHVDRHDTRRLGDVDDANDPAIVREPPCSRLMWLLPPSA